jgi:hypothetical protein
MASACIHPVWVPSPSIGAIGLGIETVETLTPVATGVETTTTRRAKANQGKKQRRRGSVNSTTYPRRNIISRTSLKPTLPF